MKSRKLARTIFLSAFVISASALVGSGLRFGTASACQSCYDESRTAAIYCRDHPGGTYVGCNFTHECMGNDTATEIYRLECLLAAR
jgi:hypothetical protein